MNGYLRIEYDYRLPLLVYTGKGWEIEKDIFSDELLQGFDRLIFNFDLKIIWLTVWNGLINKHAY